MNGWMGAAVVFVGVYAAGVALDWPVVEALAKPWPVLLLAVGVWQGGDRPGASWLAAALAVDSAADAVIEVQFVAGLAVFLVGHLLKIVAFTRDAPAWHVLRGVPFFVFAAAVVGWIGPVAGALGPPIVAYAVVISVMAWRAAARVDGSARALAGLLGAILFLTSDLLLAVHRFDPEARLAGNRYLATFLVLSTYWGGQALIASSARR